MSKKRAVAVPTKTSVFLKGVIISILVSILCIVLFSLAMLYLGIPKTMASPLSSIAYGVGAFFGSYYSAKKISEKGYLCGVIIAALLLIINIILGFIINGSPLSVFFIIRAVITLTMALLGGIFGINTNSNKSLVK